MFFATERGYVLTLNTGLDLTSATSLLLRIQPPAPSAVIDHVLDSTAITTPATGVVSYTVAQGDFPIAGPYSLQITDQSPGRVVKSAIASLYVGVPL